MSAKSTLFTHFWSKTKFCTKNKPKSATFLSFNMFLFKIMVGRSVDFDRRLQNPKIGVRFSQNGRFKSKSNRPSRNRIFLSRYIHTNKETTHSLTHTSLSSLSLSLSLFIYTRPPLRNSLSLRSAACLLALFPPAHAHTEREPDRPSQTRSRNVCCELIGRAVGPIENTALYGH